MNRHTVLIADDDQDLVSLLARRCQALGLATHTANDALTAVRRIDEAPPDLVILDVNMPGGNGLAVCELMFSGDRLRDVPVIMLTGESQPDTVRRCHEMCAYYVLKCPDVWRRIEPLLVELLDLPGQTASAADAARTIGAAETAAAATPSPGARATPAPTRQTDLIDAVFASLAPAKCLVGADDSTQPHVAFDAAESAETGGQSNDASPWILCIDDDPDLSRGVELRLREHGVAVRRALAGMEGYRRAFIEPAQAILLDFELPNGNGDYVLRRLKENPVTRDIPVIVLTGRREKSIERTMYNLGAAAFLTKPYLWNQLWNELQRFVRLPAASSV
jgi:DNA-binding response OmpR family regulator